MDKHLVARFSWTTVYNLYLYQRIYIPGCKFLVFVSAKI